MRTAPTWCLVGYWGGVGGRGYVLKAGGEACSLVCETVDAVDIGNVVGTGEKVATRRCFLFGDSGFCGICRHVMKGKGCGSASSRDEEGARSVVRVLSWYFGTVYGRLEGPGTVPFYCDSLRVGAFAVPSEELAQGKDVALFRLFVALAMFQAFRDVVIMRQQRGMRREDVELLISANSVSAHVNNQACDYLGSSEVFDLRCSVRKTAGHVDCAARPGASCQVKDATALFRRMGDMGKLPTSAWLHSWKDGQLARVRSDVIARSTDPQKRADLLVEQFARIHRVGRKLATMFVSALSTPALAPGLTPWFPEVDGNALVVIDTNVARAVDALRDPGAAKTYDARASWVCNQAGTLDLRQFGSHLPPYSPRLVQQALYSFCSKSNRTTNDDECALSERHCSACVTSICPFHARSTSS